MQRSPGFGSAVTSINNPIQGIVVSSNLNTTAIYAGAVMADAHHADVPAEWLAFLKSQQAIYPKYRRSLDLACFQLEWSLVVPQALELWQERQTFVFGLFESRCPAQRTRTVSKAGPDI